MSSSKRMLVVESEPVFRHALGSALESVGHDVTQVEDGREACLAYAPGDYDVIITGLDMPRMNGDELARTIKTLVPTQPIIMLIRSDSEPGGVSHPVDMVLRKPFSVFQLQRAIADVSTFRPAPTRSPARPTITTQGA